MREQYSRYTALFYSRVNNSARLCAYVLETGISVGVSVSSSSMSPSLSFLRTLTFFRFTT